MAPTTQSSAVFWVVHVQKTISFAFLVLVTDYKNKLPKAHSYKAVAKIPDQDLGSVSQ